MVKQLSLQGRGLEALVGLEFRGFCLDELNGRGDTDWGGKIKIAWPEKEGPQVY